MLGVRRDDSWRGVPWGKRLLHNIFDSDPPSDATSGPTPTFGARLAAMRAVGALPAHPRGLHRRTPATDPAWRPSPDGRSRLPRPNRRCRASSCRSLRRACGHGPTSSGTSASGAAYEARSPDRDQPVGLVTRRDLDVRRAECAPRHHAPPDDAVGTGPAGRSGRTFFHQVVGEGDRDPREPLDRDRPQPMGRSARGRHRP